MSMNSITRTLQADSIEGVYAPRNIIKYSDFENGTTTGYGLGTIGTLTNGLPTGSPTFGSGASGNLSISTITSGNQLSGSYSLQIVNSGATVVGNMIHTDALSVNLSEQAKVLNFRLNYQTLVQGGMNLSGTSSNGVAVAVYDVTNSVFIPVQGAFNFIQGSGVGIATGSIQSGYNTASLRFILYFPTASTGSINFIVDDIYLGQQPGVSGLAGSETKQNNLAIANLGTITSQKDFQYRIGDTLYGYGSGISGAPVASTFSIPLPTGLNIDYTKINAATNLSIVGEMHAIDGTAVSAYASVSHGPFPLFVDGSTTNAVFCSLSTSSNALVKTNGSSVSATSAGYSYSFSVPILGWPSNVQQSSDSNQSILASSYWVSSNFAATATTPINFDSKEFDTNGAVTTSATAWKYTSLSSGTFSVALFVDQNAVSAITYYIYKNGTKYKPLVFSPSTTAAGGGGSTNIQLVANDYIDIRPDANITVTGGPLSGASTNVSISKLANPQTIQASEKVYAQYTGNAGTVLTANVTNIDFVTKVTDSSGSWNGTTFTAGRPGWFDFKGHIRIASTTTLSLVLYKNGSALFRVTDFDGTSSTDYGFNAGTYLNQNETMSLRSDSGCTLSNSATTHWMAITSQG